jgi:hypothetical protein
MITTTTTTKLKKDWRLPQKNIENIKTPRETVETSPNIAWSPGFEIRTAPSFLSHCPPPSQARYAPDKKAIEGR